MSSCSIDNWQTALRKQYFKRNPDANPIGPEPEVPSRHSSVESDITDGEEDALKKESSPSPPPAADGNESEVQAVQEEPSDEISLPPNGTGTESAMQEEPTAVEPPESTDFKKEDTQEPKADAMDALTESSADSQSRDWNDLAMLEKLDSLHLLTEWQFQNPYRLRQLMKSDDETASWVSWFHYESFFAI